ncbi:MAG: hypothetical protein AAGN66_11235 [Acidobacteriota bacterium]
MTAQLALCLVGLGFDPVHTVELVQHPPVLVPLDELLGGTGQEAASRNVKLRSQLVDSFEQGLVEGDRTQPRSTDATDLDPRR